VSLHVTIRMVLAAWFAERYYLVPVPALLFAAGLLRRFQRPAAAALAAIQVARFLVAFPDVSNHYLVEVLCVLAFAAVDLERAEERELVLRGLGWLAVVVFFMSGLQKCLHGSWFHGQYLAYMVANTDRFHDFFAPILPHAELERLTALHGAVEHIRFGPDGPVGPMPGPYRVDSTLFVIISNSIWLGEMAVAIGLLVRRLRTLALIGGVLIMAGIAAASHELFFDTLYLNLLLLFATTAVNRKLLPLSLASYAFYLLGGLGVVHVEFVW